MGPSQYWSSFQSAIIENRQSLIFFDIAPTARITEIVCRSPTVSLRSLAQVWIITVIAFFLQTRFSSSLRMYPLPLLRVRPLGSYVSVPFKGPIDVPLP